MLLYVRTWLYPQETLESPLHEGPKRERPLDSNEAKSRRVLGTAVRPGSLGLDNFSVKVLNPSSWTLDVFRICCPFTETLGRLSV